MTSSSIELQNSESELPSGLPLIKGSDLAYFPQKYDLCGLVNKNLLIIILQIIPTQNENRKGTYNICQDHINYENF